MLDNVRPFETTKMAIAAPSVFTLLTAIVAYKLNDDYHTYSSCNNNDECEVGYTDLGLDIISFVTTVGITGLSYVKAYEYFHQ
jgi:hypothetical protein